MVVARLAEAGSALVELPAKHGRPAVYVDMDCLWEHLYAVESLLRHLERYGRGWRTHLDNVHVPRQLVEAIGARRATGSKLALFGSGRSVEPVARLTGLNARTIRRRIVEFYENRGAHLYFCARPPDRPMVYSVGNVFTPKPDRAPLLGRR